MKLKEMSEEELEQIAATIDNEGFGYTMLHGGWIKPEDILDNPKDAKKVNDAIETLREFESILPEL